MTPPTPTGTAITTDPLKYHGDQDLAPGLLDLAVNVRGDQPPGWLTSRLQRGFSKLAAYPDPTVAVQAVARRHERSPDEVLVTAGAAEAFVLIARAFRPQRAVCIHPSFTEPEAALTAAGHPVERLQLAPPYQLDPELVPDDADLVVIGNPTNPTGVVHERLRDIARPGRITVVDEAFMDAIPGEPHSLAGQRLPGLVVVRSLTKTWALAGLRVGYLLADPVLIVKLKDAQPLWSVGTLGLIALDACLARGPVKQAERDAPARSSRCAKTSNAGSPRWVSTSFRTARRRTCCVGFPVVPTCAICCAPTALRYDGETPSQA